MANHRPPRWVKTPAQIALERREIAKRYAAGGTKTVRGAWFAAIRLAELTRWLEHTFGAGVELEPEDKRSETIIRVFVHHLIVLKDGPRRASDWMRLYCPWLALRSRETLISEASHCTIHFKARTLGWKLKLTDDLRVALAITTISPIDVSDDELQARRKAKRAALMRAARAARKPPPA